MSEIIECEEEKKYIVLDWNVIQRIKCPNKDDDVKLKKIVEFLNKEFVFPYCEAHLTDLSQSNNEKYIIEDIEFLAEISRGYVICIAPIKGENFLLCSDDNLSLCKDNTKNLGYNIYKNFQETKYKEESEDLIVKTMSNGTSEIFLNPESYENIRNSIKTVKNYLQGKKIPNKRKYLNFLTCLEITNEEELSLKWKNAVVDWLKTENRPITYGNLITTAYNLLDFHPKFYDKFRKKNRNKPDNIRRDSKIVFFASKSNYFITKDQSCAKKTKFIYKVLGIKTEVILVDKTEKFLNSSLKDKLKGIDL